jgi:hypothetical protein
MKAKIKAKIYLFFFTSTLRYRSNTTKLMLCVVCVRKARHMTFQVNPSYESQDEKKEPPQQNN